MLVEPFTLANTEPATPGTGSDCLQMVNLVPSALRAPTKVAGAGEAIAVPSAFIRMPSNA